ncbi:uncharacterized protein PAC_03545 [Phialocephala subalpina]|uniref:Uncharacterized protein n=1 Tax=Phialocephala subalpina TaxID=576137 RepID=A0A1L7WLM7_9HELO|nr:uncharacterized protein PAC_03545 [Phialocephala subalpina]
MDLNTTTFQITFWNGLTIPRCHHLLVALATALPTHPIAQMIPWISPFDERQKSRKREFVKHIESFILRGVVDERCLAKCIEILRPAEKAKELREQEDVVMEDVKEGTPVSNRRGHFICICGKFTQPPNRVVCTGSQCPARFFCRECAKKDGRPVVKTWKCNECFSDSTA